MIWSELNEEREKIAGAVIYFLHSDFQSPKYLKVQKTDEQI